MCSLNQAKEDIMAIYLATNSSKDVSGSLGDVTTAGRFDANYVSSAIKTYYQSNQSWPIGISVPNDVSADAATWFHFDLYTPVTQSLSADGSWCRGICDDNALGFYIDMADGSLLPRIYDAAGGSTIGTSFVLPVGLNTFDIYWSDDGTTAILEIYSNGVLIGSATRTSTSTGNRGAIKRIQFENNDIVGSSADGYMSQIIWSNVSTVSLKMQEIAPSAVGNYTDLSATITEVNDDDGTTGWASATATEKQSFTIAGYTAPAGRIIHSVVPGFKMRTGATGPQNIRPFLRISAVDYNGPADIGPFAPTKNGFVGHDWALNPATGLAWTSAEVAAIEAGFEVKA